MFAHTLLTDTLHCALKYSVYFLCFGIILCLADSLSDERDSKSLRNVNTFLSQTARCHPSESSNLLTKFIRLVWLQ